MCPDRAFPASATRTAQQSPRLPYLLPAADSIHREGRKGTKHVRKHRKTLFSLLIGVGKLFSESQHYRSRHIPTRLAGSSPVSVHSGTCQRRTKRVRDPRRERDVYSR